MRLSALLVPLAVLTAGAAITPPASGAPGAPPAAVRGGLPWLGVAMEAGDANGVGVNHVVRGSPADKAGVKERDRIVRVDGRAVRHANEVTRAVTDRKTGEVVALVVLRDGKELTLQATLEARPSQDDVLRMDHVGAFAPAWRNVVPLGAAPKALSDLKGRVVVLDFWATWCGPCRMVAPRLSALSTRYGAEGLSVVGVTTDEAETAAAFVRRADMKYPSVIDQAAETMRAYGVSGLPTLFVIDKRGVVREVMVGFDPMHDGGLEHLVKTLLAEPAQAP